MIDTDVDVSNTDPSDWADPFWAFAQQPLVIKALTILAIGWFVHHAWTRWHWFRYLLPISVGLYVAAGMMGKL